MLHFRHKCSTGGAYYNEGLIKMNRHQKEGDLNLGRARSCKRGRVFSHFFLKHFLLVDAVFSSCSFFLETHFGKVLETIDFYGNKIGRDKGMSSSQFKKKCGIFHFFLYKAVFNATKETKCLTNTIFYYYFIICLLHTYISKNFFSNFRIFPINLNFT